MSTLTTNVVLMLAIWGIYCDPLCKAVYRKRKKDPKAEPPPGMSWVFFFTGFFLLVVWMSIWGVPTNLW